VSTIDVIIIGAGPYGISAAAHLRTIDGLEVREFGEPMSFWDRNMPVGMLLRSNWTATQIASPKNWLTIEAYMAETSDRLAQPVPLDGFIRYGQWYQEKAVSDLDHRNIMRVESDSKGFKTTLADGETIFSKRVVVAAGIGSFARRPREFDNLPASLASHTSMHRDLKEFAGKKVLVVGGGQSALESAALLHESGAEAEVVSRSTHINWLSGWASTTLHKRLGKFTRQLLYAPTDVGPAGISQLVARPALLQALPRSVQDKLRKRAVRPAGARWLVERLRDVPVSLGRSVTSVDTVGDQASIRLNDGTSRTVDHVLLGTGYQVDVSKYAFLSPELIRSIRCFNGFPCLKAGLETSVPGLHVLGAPAAWSFGPLMQFVSGTTYASRSLTHHIAKNRRVV
jgi:cation diffusion facilitator CzcD-associated flavoprotein CzcO